MKTGPEAIPSALTNLIHERPKIIEFERENMAVSDSTSCPLRRKGSSPALFHS